MMDSLRTNSVFLRILQGLLSTFAVSPEIVMRVQFCSIAPAVSRQFHQVAFAQSSMLGKGADPETILRREKLEAFLDILAHWFSVMSASAIQGLRTDEGEDIAMAPPIMVDIFPNQVVSQSSSVHTHKTQGRHMAY